MHFGEQTLLSHCKVSESISRLICSYMNLVQSSDVVGCMLWSIYSLQKRTSLRFSAKHASGKWQKETRNLSIHIGRTFHNPVTLTFDFLRSCRSVSLVLIAQVIFPWSIEDTKSEMPLITLSMHRLLSAWVMIHRGHCIWLCNVLWCSRLL